MKEKFQRFMYGRYGMDSLGRFMLWTAVLLFVLSTFTDNRFFYLIAFVLMIFEYVRMLSRSISKRSSENRLYLSYVSRVKRYFEKQKYLMQLRKDYRIFSCPECKQKIKIPKGRKKVEIRCPK